MIYTAECPEWSFAQMDEIMAACPQIVDESMRCGPPVRDRRQDGNTGLYPDRTIVHTAAEHGYAYVARDGDGAICGVALIWPDGHVKWLVLPAADSLAVCEALLDHYKDMTGISPHGEVETDALRELLLTHPSMSVTEKKDGIQWR